MMMRKQLLTAESRAETAGVDGSALTHGRSCSPRPQDRGRSPYAVRVTGRLDVPLRRTDATILRAGYEFHELLIGALARPASLITLGTGLILGVGTKWGIVKYYWPLAKLVLVVATIAITASLTPGWIAIAFHGADTPLTGEFTATQSNLVGMAVFHILTIGAAAWLSIYKPGGRTRWSQPARPSAP